MTRAADLRCVALLIGLTALAWAPRLAGPIDLRSDSGVYYVLGTSLAQGRGYRLLNEPGEPRAIQYPPLLPALVALHQRALGTGDPHVVGPWLRRTYAALSLLYALAIFALARQYLGPGWATLATSMAAFEINTLCYEEMLYSEIPFALATVLFAVAARRDGGRTFSPAASLLGVAAYLVRSAGVALLAAWVAESLLRGRWAQAAARAAVALAPILAWQAYVGRVASGEDYRHPAYAYQRAPYQYSNVGYAENAMLAHPFAPEEGRLGMRGLAARVATNLAAAPSGVGGFLFAHRGLRTLMDDLGRRAGLPPGLGRVVEVVLALQGLLILGGLGLLAARRDWFIPLYVAASLVLIATTPWASGFSRYATPLLPFFFLSLVLLLSRLAAPSPRRRPRPLRLAGPVLAGLVIAPVLAKDARSAASGLLVARNTAFRGEARRDREDYRLMRYGEGSYRLDEALDWLRRHAGPGEVVATQEPHWAYLNAGLKAVMPPMEIDPATAQRLLDSVPVAYLLLDETDILDVTPRYARPVPEAFPDLWELAYAAPGSKTFIYRRR